MKQKIGGIHNPTKSFVELGYTHRQQKNDYVLPDTNGRYHAIPGKSGIDLHYDLQGPSGLHITNIPMPVHLHKEVVRIQRYVAQNNKVDKIKNIKENILMEYKPFDHDKAVQAFRLLIEALGEDPERDGLKETPERAAKFWSQVIDYSIDPTKYLKMFSLDAPNTNKDMVFVKAPLYSYCEHHLAGFRGEISIAYIPTEKVIGLSKLVRIARVFAKRLQVQERLQTQIADFLSENLSSDVMVYIAAEHSCMTIRGVRTPESKTRSATRRGIFQTEANRENEFWQYVNQNGR